MIRRKKVKSRTTARRHAVDHDSLSSSWDFVFIILLLLFPLMYTNIRVATTCPFQYLVVVVVVLVLAEFAKTGWRLLPIPNPRTGLASPY